MITTTITTTAKLEAMLAAVDAAYVRRLDIEHYLSQSKALDAEERARREQAGSPGDTFAWAMVETPDLDAKRAELLALAQRKFHEVLAEHDLLPTV